MSQRKARILRTLLNRYNPNDREKLLGFLPVHEQQAIAAQKIETYEIAPLLFQHQHTLEKLHYSWLRPILNKFPEELTSYFAASLSPVQAEGLISQKVPNIHLPQQIKLFIRSLIFKHLDLEDMLPFEFLPPSEFSSLLNMDKKDLINIFDFLGLFDLAAEVRRIVNPTYLKNIYTALTPKQFHYLKICMHQKEKLVSPPLGIDASIQDNAAIKQLIHKRGLIRLGKALCGEHKDLVRYIAYILDTGRGKILLDQYRPVATPAITSVLHLQVMNVINFLKKE